VRNIPEDGQLHFNSHGLYRIGNSGGGSCKYGKNLRFHEAAGKFLISFSTGLWSTEAIINLKRIRLCSQVKVWFQNRRTKHKRMQQEEEAKAQQAAAASNKNSHHVTKWKQETQGQGTDENSRQQYSSSSSRDNHSHHQDVRDVDSCSSGSET
jgi:hypothetical protein